MFYMRRFFFDLVYVVGTQKTCLNEMVLLRTLNTCLDFTLKNLCLTEPMNNQNFRTFIVDSWVKVQISKFLNVQNSNLKTGCMPTKYSHFQV